MPKIVDHDDRRQEIIEATWAVIARAGIPGATTRSISMETGYSTGTLAHYFKDKQDLLVQALEAAHAEVRQIYQRVRKDRDLRGLQAVREYVWSCLPIDEHRTRLAAVELAFWGEAIANPDLISINKAETDGFYERISALLIEARELGEIPVVTDIRAAARSLRILNDGLSIQSVVYPDLPSPDEQLKMLDALLNNLRHPTPDTVSES